VHPAGADDGAVDPGRAVYGIGVAAELVGTGPQNLRQYEARGLLTPARSEGGTRRYSNDDLDRLREIGRLLEAGLNLAGVEMVLGLRAANAHLRARLEAAVGRAGPLGGARRVGRSGAAPASGGAGRPPSGLPR
jgi:MerR family transcriptional regulator/heat shock protein HspR